MTYPHISILMATFNGGKFLSEQLQSIVDQTHTNWSLWIGDDGSTDDTLQIVTEFANSNPLRDITIIRQPGLGAGQNFMSLSRCSHLPTGMIAFADQDDVWLPDRLARGVSALRAFASKPALYGSRTLIVDERLNHRGLSPLHNRPPGFRNAIVQSIAGGNTMLLNQAARDLLKAIPQDIHISMHDWWAYQIVSAAGGTVVYDPTPTLCYRQHANNLVGANRGALAQMRRMHAVVRNRLRDWNTRNLNALDLCRNFITKENQKLLNAFHEVRSHTGHRAVRMLRNSGIHRQTGVGDKSLKLAAFVGKL